MEIASKAKEDSILNNDLKRCIKTLTHTGEKSLDPKVLKEITKICKKSNDFVINAYHLIMEYLAENHSEIRYSAFQLSDELFRRSHCFRELMVANLQRVLELTLETNIFVLLPPPKKRAEELKKLALSTINEWCTEYGNGYKKLNLAVSFLKQCKKVDLNAMALERQMEESHQAELERRKKALYSEHYKKVLEEIVEKRPDIVSTITELESCISLLMPSPESFFIEEDLPAASEPVIASSSNTTKGEDTDSDSNCDTETDSDEDVEMETSRGKIFDFRKYGIINPQIGLKLNLDIKDNPIIKETEENRDIIQSARDLHKLLNGRFCTCLDKWIATITKYQEVLGTTRNVDIASLTQLKGRLISAVNKFDQLNLGSLGSNCSKDTEEDTSDSDFEEVEGKAGYEDFVKTAPVEADPLSVVAAKPKKITKKDWSLVSEENNEKDPTTALSTLSTIKTKNQQTSLISKESVEIPKEGDKNQESSQKKEKNEEPVAGPSGLQRSVKKETSERKSKLLSIAPKLPFDVDLYHWEDEKLTAPTMLTVKPDTHRFWTSAADELEEVVVPDGEAALRTRVIEFAGEFQPVKWACRAPLPSGKLCPRKDRVKCPLHGRIVGRDKNGVPTDSADRQAEKEKAESANLDKVPDWQDPALLAELKESTGVDLRMPDKSKRGWRKRLPGEQESKYVGLTDIKAARNTTKRRLSKKLFNRRAMRRVACDMDKQDRKKFHDKYGDQFNYVFEH